MSLRNSIWMRTDSDYGIFEKTYITRMHSSFVNVFQILKFSLSVVIFHHHDHHTAFKFLRLISIQNKNNDFFSIVYSQIKKDKGKIVFVSHYVIQNTRSHAFFIIIIIRFRKTIETVELKTRASC